MPLVSRREVDAIESMERELASQRAALARKAETRVDLLECVSFIRKQECAPTFDEIDGAARASDRSDMEEEDGILSVQFAEIHDFGELKIKPLLLEDRERPTDAIVSLIVEAEVFRVGWRRSED